MGMRSPCIVTVGAPEDIWRVKDTTTEMQPHFLPRMRLVILKVIKSTITFLFAALNNYVLRRI
jgi:hypothetical protein